MALEPGCDERAVFVRPVVVEFVFGELGIAFCANRDTHELFIRHFGRCWKGEIAGGREY